MNMEKSFGTGIVTSILITAVLCQETGLTTYKGNVSTLNCPEQQFSAVRWEGPPNFTPYYNYEGTGQFGDIGSKVSRLNISANFSLIIRNTQLDDAGIYRCIKTGRINSQIVKSTAVTTVEVRIRAAAPSITTIVPKNDSNILATEDVSVNIYCTSRGGSPAPTVVLYEGSVGGRELPTSSSVTPEGETFVVTLNYTFTPRRQNDGQLLVCRSYWPTPVHVQDSQLTTATLYLYLKPTQPIIIQTNSVVTGTYVILECQTSGSRPAANISWTYRQQLLTAYNTTTQTLPNGTFRTTSLLRRRVTSEDNGQDAVCRVSNIVATLTETKRVNVFFPVSPSTTNITGNKVIVADGVNELSLTCTTGSSNPGSTISWMQNSRAIETQSPYSSWTGDNNGIVRSQNLTMRPTRNERGDTITCSVFNNVSTSEVTASVILELHYQPTVTINATTHLNINEETAPPSLRFPCTVDSNPLSKIIWRHNGHVVTQEEGVISLPYSIFNINRTSYGNYTCTADNGIAHTDSKTYTVNIHFRPLNITIVEPGIITADGKNNMSISCETGSSNPVAVITWITGTIQTNSPVNSNKSGPYGGSVTTSMITFTPTRDHDGMTVTCTAINNLFSDKPIADTTTISNIHYSPLINTLTDQTAVEGENIVLKCSANSKPTAIFRWSFNSETVAQGNGTTFYNGLDYSIFAVSRTQAGTYTCSADNQILPNDLRQTRLVVQYPPDVEVTAINTTINNKSTTLTCDALGVPDQYTYDHWVHKFNGIQVSYPELLPASRELTITGLSYAHSGVYRCGASNGVKGIVSHNDGTLLVQSFPIIVGDIASTKEIKATGQLTKPTVVTFQYYSNAGIGSVRVRKSNVSGEVLTTHQRSVEVKLPVFQSVITTLGTEVSINISVAEESLFGKYEISVLNEIGLVDLSLIIQPLGPPETPTFLNSTVLDHHSVIISWISGFPNGLNQTFVVQLSTDNSTWRNITQFGGLAFKQTHTQTVDNLASSQMYFARMFAQNERGESQPTDIFNFETAATSDSTPSSSVVLKAVGAGGGAVAALVVIAVIFFVVRRKYTSPSGKTNDKGVLVMSSNSKEDENEEVINRLYESAGPCETETEVGASIGKQTLTPDGGNIYAKVNKMPEAVYAMPNKEKGLSTTLADVTISNAQRETDVYAVSDRAKGKHPKEHMKQKLSKADKGGKKYQDKNMKKKHQTGDVYENAPDIMFGNNSTLQSGESVYEDTSTNIASASMKPTGTDGLLYADLEFGPKKKGPTKIIGMEDRCEYTTIDLTKKAQPLPDSDDEDKSKK